MRKFIIMAFTPLLFACNNSTQTTVEEHETAEVEILNDDFDYEKYLEIGDEMAFQTQQILMSNVAQAMKAYGPAGAVDFCNEKAVVLTDSASEMFMAEISRVSDKNRNSNNSISSDFDKKAWSEIQTMMSDTSVKIKHKILRENNETFYYKAIPLGMETCLKCHGNVGSDIAQETYDAIKSKYPSDKATGYEMGQLRGLWKIKLNTEL